MRFIGFLILLLLYSCARVGRPIGGEKDVKPPISITANPDFGTTNFNSDKIKIYFDEYIKLKDLNKQLNISPPSENNPVISPMGTASKIITIKLLDSLKNNTTYTFNFGNAIVDNNEGNVLKKFKYVFSTGDYIDSLSVKGAISDAFYDSFKEMTTVMLYELNENFNDSIIYHRRPNYVTFSDENNTFEITNVKKGNYSLIAIQDKSNNMIFNPKEDKIAFYDSIISLPIENLDSIFILRLFSDRSKPDVMKPTEVSENHLTMGFQGKWMGKDLTILNENKENIDFLYTKDRAKDTIHLWYKTIDTDSLKIRFNLNNEKKEFVIKKRNKNSDSLSIKVYPKNILHFNDTLYIESNIPIAQINKEKFKLINTDSIEIPLMANMDKNLDRIYLNFKKEPKQNYNLTIDSLAIIDFLGNSNRYENFKFSTKNLEDYGELNLKIISDFSPLIVELLDEKLGIINKQIVNENTSLNYQLLQPGKFKIRLTWDENKNNEWDTGDYINKKQPEKVYYFNKTIDLRANWTVNEEIFFN